MNDFLINAMDLYPFFGLMSLLFSDVLHYMYTYTMYQDDMFGTLEKFAQRSVFYKLLLQCPKTR